MTDPVKEQLSACLDGELPEGELDLLLKQVNRDVQLRESLGRYALIGETLRARAPVVAPADFSKRIAAAIAEEPVRDLTSARPGATPRRWLRPVAGFAVAAGVAAVAVMSLREPQPLEPAAYVAQSAPLPATSTGEAASYIVPTSTGSSAFVPAARLTNYVVAHSEYSSPLGRRSVLSGVLSEEDSDDDPDGLDSDEAADVVTKP